MLLPAKYKAYTPPLPEIQQGVGDGKGQGGLGSLWKTVWAGVGFRLDPEAKERGLERVLEASIELCEQPLEQGVDLGSHLWWGGLCVALR